MPMELQLLVHLQIRLQITLQYVELGFNFKEKQQCRLMTRILIHLNLVDTDDYLYDE